MALEINLIRPDDLLNLQIEGRNLKLDTGTPGQPVLVLEDPTQVGYLIVRFPPQTIAEEAVYEPTSTSLENKSDRQKTETEQEQKRREKGSNTTSDIATILKTRAMRARMGQPSRLVFRIPANSKMQIPYTVEGLLNWENLELSVSGIAAIAAIPGSDDLNNAPAIAPPADTETAIELPYRLILSPNQTVVWSHAAQPKSDAGRTELWHTRLAYRDTGKIVDFSKTNPAPLRAIWSPDYAAKPSNQVPWPILGKLDQWAGQDVLTAMNARDRHELVVLTSAFRGFIKSGTDTSTYVPAPILAEQMILSPLGGWLKSRGSWQPPVEWIFRLPLPIPAPTPIPIPIPIPIPRPIPRFTESLTPEEVEPEDNTDAPASLMEFLNPVLRRPDLLGPIDRIPLPIPPIRFGIKGEPLNISEWVHVATQGRDHYVRIVYEGYLYPFGHRAALIKMTERKFRDVTGTPVAYLSQRMFIVVRQPLKDYTQEALPNQGRGMPLKQVRLTTLITPDIELPTAIAGTQYSFWVRVPGQDFRFHGVGQDRERHTVDFTAVLIFVPNSDVGKIAAVRKEYNTANDRRACSIPGQKVTYAERNGNASDNTTLTTRSLFFDTDDAVSAIFLPKLAKASVNLSAVEQLVGSTAAVDIQYYKNFISSGFDTGNEVFAELINKVQSSFSADKGGGIATPDLSITGVTRKLGVVAGDLGKASLNNFDPKDFFKDVEDAANLFGKIKLTELLAPGSFDNAPTIQFFPQASPPQVKLDWKPKIQNVDVGFFQFVRETDSELEIQGVIQQPVDGSLAHAQFTGKLTHFFLEFLQVVRLSFDAFRFNAETGKKTDVNVQLKPDNALEFLGDLTFVNDLKSLIPPALFVDGPSLELLPDPAIRAGFAIGLPPAAVGIFALKDVSLGAALTIPFLDGSPLFDFNISERQHPFNLTIAFFGGGGFFHLQLDTKAVRVVEAAFEFGASASIDLGVASGGVHIMAGIYFKLENRIVKVKDVKGVEVDRAVNSTTLSGYLRMGGELSVLGLISVSLEFNLSFTYKTPGKAYGRATLTVKVEVLFFSKSVEISVEKQFGNSSSDPSFAQVWDEPALWSEYATAFA